MSRAQSLKAFNRLFADHHQRFVKFARSYLQSNELAEDFTSDAFMRYWETMNDLKPGTNAPAYILTIIKHKCINHLQHLRVQQLAEKKITQQQQWNLATRIATLEACEPDFIFSDEIQSVMNATLKSLPPKTREAFNMSREDGLTHKEIAAKMGISTKGVEFHISKALKIIRYALKDYLAVLVFLFCL